MHGEGWRSGGGLNASYAVRNNKERLTPKSSAASLNLHAFDGEGQGVKQDCEIHKEPSISDVVEIVLRILMNEEGAVRTQLP